MRRATGAGWRRTAGRARPGAQLEPKKDINAKLGEGRSTDALDSIALTVALEFPMLIDDGARERMLERRRRYEENPFELALLEGAADLTMRFSGNPSALRTALADTGGDKKRFVTRSALVLRSLGDRVRARRQGAGAAKTVQELIDRDEDRGAAQPGVELSVEEGVGPAVNKAHDRGAAHVPAQLLFR